MPIQDLIVKDLDVSYEGVFDLHDFLDYLKKWYKRNGYDVDEKLYDAKGKGDAIKSLRIKWDAEKKMTDYDRFLMKITITANDLKEGKVENRKVTEGKVNVSFEGWHDKDYDEKWRKKPTFNFLRAVYDKFVLETPEGRIVKKLKSDTFELRDEVKKYFNIEE